MTAVNKFSTFGEHLRLKREKAGLSLKKVAANIEIDTSTLSKIEKNERSANEKLLEKPAEVFHLNIGDLKVRCLSDKITYQLRDEENEIEVFKVAEQKTRKYLIDNNYVDAEIQLPPDLFFGTTITTCVVVLKKSKKDKAAMFIDASAEFVRDGDKNKLNEASRKKIRNAFIERKDIDHFTRLVPNGDIAAQYYNIAINSYVEQENTTEDVDIEKLNSHIAEIVIRQNKFSTAIDEIVADLEGCSI